MADIDLPAQDAAIQAMPAEMRKDLAELGRRDLMFFSKGILGYKDLTVKCHGPLTSYLTNNTSQYKLILYPRDHFKTSVGTISGNMQRYLRNSEERILIANESATNAERFLRAIRQHAESNRKFRALYSDVIPKDTRKVRWNDGELDFNRKGFFPEPTFDTIGMTGSVVSRHYTHMSFDDPISEEAIKSELVMTDVINRLSGLMALMVEPEINTVWLIGTRWALFDVYTWFRKTFAQRLSVFARGAIEDGEPIFSERFSLEILAMMRQSMGEYKFSCLMLNNPRNSDIQDLNVDDLKYFRFVEDGSHVELLDRDGAVYRRCAIGDMDISTTVDLAPAERTTSDRNAVVTVGVTAWDDVVVLDAWGARCTPLVVIQKLFDLKRRYNVRRFGIEGVAYQKAFKYFLKAEAERAGMYLRVEELKAIGKKEIRIRGLQPIMATGRMYIDPKAHILRGEMADFPLGEHDDVVDSLAMQLQMLRGQVSPEAQARLQDEVRSILGDSPQLRRELDLDPDEQIDKEFLPQNWTDYVDLRARA